MKTIQSILDEFDKEIAPLTESTADIPAWIRLQLTEFAEQFRMEEKQPTFPGVSTLTKGYEVENLNLIIREINQRIEEAKK